MQNKIKVLLFQYRVQIVQTEPDQVCHLQLTTYQSLYCLLSFPPGTQNAANDFKVAEASSMVIPVFSDVILAASTPSPARFWQARHSKGALLPPQVTNRSLDSSQISRDRFLTRREISSRLISSHP